jgi:hypothetical protein
LLRGLVASDRTVSEDRGSLPEFTLPTVSTEEAPVESPEVEAPPAETAEVEAPATELVEEVLYDVCPRCQGKMIDPQGMGWCRGCGYCKSLEEDRARVPAAGQRAQRQPSLLGVNDFFFLLTKIPDWAYVMLAGSVAVFLGSLMPAAQLATGSFERAVWATIQIGGGLALLFVAQLILVFRLAPMDEKITFKDAVLPFRVWGLAFPRGGQMRVSFWLGAWGLSAIVAAIVVIGGLQYWERYLPRSTPQDAPAQATPKK